MTMTRMRNCSAAIGLAISLSLTAVRADDSPTTAPAAGEKVDNPLFAAWSKFDPGASCTYETDMGPADHKMHLSATMTLKAKNADTVSVEVTSNVNGNPMPAQTMTLSAKIVAADAKKTGEQDVTIADKTYKCTVYELGPSAMGAAATAQPGEKITACVSEEVPGGMAKMTGRASDGQEMSMAMTSCKTK
jgi:hypothetical protein